MSSDWFKGRGTGLVDVIAGQLKTIKDDIVGPVDALETPCSRSDYEQKIAFLERRLKEAFNGMPAALTDEKDLMKRIKNDVQNSINDLDSIMKVMNTLIASAAENKRLKHELVEVGSKHEVEVDLCAKSIDLVSCENKALRDQMKRQQASFASKINQMELALTEKEDRINHLEKNLCKHVSEAFEKGKNAEKSVNDMYAVLDEFQKERDRMMKKLNANYSLQIDQLTCEREKVRLQKDELEVRLHELQNAVIEEKRRNNELQSDLSELNREYTKLQSEAGALHATLRHLSPMTSNRIEKYLVKKMLISYWKADGRVRSEALTPILRLLEFEEDEVKCVRKLHGEKDESIAQMLIKYVDQQTVNDQKEEKN